MQRVFELPPLFLMQHPPPKMENNRRVAEEAVRPRQFFFDGRNHVRERRLIIEEECWASLEPFY